METSYLYGPGGFTEFTPMLGLTHRVGNKEHLGAVPCTAPVFDLTRSARE